jgi:hypothetical protein
MKLFRMTAPDQNMLMPVGQLEMTLFWMSGLALL